MSMYNLIEYSSNYSEITASLWFYSEDEGTYFNVDIINNNNFQYKAKLLGNAAAQADNTTNENLKNAAISLPLKYSSNFWRSL